MYTYLLWLVQFKELFVFLKFNKIEWFGPQYNVGDALPKPTLKLDKN